MWSKNVPLVGGLYHITDFDQMWSKIVPLVGGLCHVMDFNQMWSKNVPLTEDFVTSRTSTKCGTKKCAPLWRTLSRLWLLPNVVQKCAPCQRTLSHLGLYSVMIRHMPRFEKNNNHVRKEGIDQWYPWYERYQSQL